MTVDIYFTCCSLPSHLLSLDFSILLFLFFLEGGGRWLNDKQECRQQLKCSVPGNFLSPCLLATPSRKTSLFRWLSNWPHATHTHTENFPSLPLSLFFKHTHTHLRGTQAQLTASSSFSSFLCYVKIKKAALQEWNWAVMLWWKRFYEQTAAAARRHVVAFISRVITGFYYCQALPITIRGQIRLFLMSNVQKCKNIPTNNTLTQEASTVKYECFNLTGVCWIHLLSHIYNLLNCSHIHIHSFHKKYIFVYTAFTLSYSRAVRGTSLCMYGRPKNTSDPSHHYVSYVIMRSPSVCLTLPAQLPGIDHIILPRRPPHRRHPAGVSQQKQ